MSQTKENIGEIITECLNKPFIQNMCSREKVLENDEKMQMELARAIGYCMLFRSTENIEEYMLLSIREEQEEFLKNKIVNILNIMDEDDKNKLHQICKYIEDKIIKNGYVFHATNSLSAEKKMKEGLNGKGTTDKHKKELEEINNIYVKYGENIPPLGWGIRDLENENSGWFYEGTARFATYYANSPEWFRQFCGESLSYYQVIPQENRYGYAARDYDTALLAVSTLIEKYNMVIEDKEKILSFFEKSWATFSKTTPQLILVPMSEIEKNKYDDNRDLGEFLDFFLHCAINGGDPFASNVCCKTDVSADKLICVDLSPIMLQIRKDENKDFINENDSKEKYDIDQYINQAKKMEEMDHSGRSGTPAYRFGDVILVRYGVYKTKVEEKLIAFTDEAVKNGAKTPRHLAVKNDGEFCWVLQETAKGVNAIIDHKDVNEYWYNIVKGPKYYYENLLTTMKELYGCGLEIRSENVFFDKGEGFSIIDLDEKPQNKIDLKNQDAVNRMIEDYSSVYKTLVPYNQRNDLISGYVLYRQLNIAQELIPEFEVSSVEYYKNLYEYSDIFDEFAKRIEGTKSFEEIENIAYSMYEEYQKAIELLRRKR